MSAFTTRLPRKSSRTRTQAITVPVTALIAATIAESITVSSIAERASGALTASQNAPRPPSSPRASTAASGSRTIRLRYAVARAPAIAGRAGRRARGARRGAGSVAASAGGDTELPLDLGHLALVGVEELIVDLRPAAELGDREQPRRARVFAGVQFAFEHWAVPVVGEDPLRRRGVQEVHERPRLRGVLGVLGHRDRVLDQD